MKPKSYLIVCMAAVSALAASTFAQDIPRETNERMELHDGNFHHPREGWHPNRLNHVAKASDILGMTVKNYQDEKLGKVEELAVDLETGRIVQVVLSTGGFLGMGNALTAVPPGALHLDAVQKVVHLDADKAKLKAAPKFDTSKWDEATQSNRVVEVYTYYGERPYFVAGDPLTEEARQDMNAKLASTMPRNMDGTINTEAGRSVDRVRNVEIARQAEGYYGSSNRMADGTWTRDYRTANYSWAKLGRVEKASKLIGKTVKNLQDEKLGKVENLLVDLGAGRVVFVVVTTGGFMGIGDELSPVPPAAFRVDEPRDVLHLDVSKEMLMNSPHFKVKEWPDFNQPAYTGRAYSAYRIEPYFTAYPAADMNGMRRDVRDRTDRMDATKDADNTARNVRDRNNGTLTPFDQGNSQEDLDATAQIRKEIIANDSMSVNAKNVKIITKDGRVTLRGPVKSEEEKRMIGEIANRVSPARSVNNQIEVERNPDGNK